MTDTILRVPTSRVPPRPQGARVASALDLLDGASESLVESSHAVQVRERYLTAHLAALRAAAAVLAIRGPQLVGAERPSGGPRRLRARPCSAAARSLP